MPPEAAPKITDVAISEEMRDSFMTFAMSVIVARALPDVRDGLKPAQRRILYAMHAMHLGPTARFSKCAGVVGETMKKYHPHGDEAIYPTLARMAQEWNLRYPLVEGHGNFGSVDGDPPGAMRYTEARLSRLGAEMMEDIEKETVDFTDNFDQSTTEPTALPSRFPNLLCNGASGIAVAMATNLPPHNLGEICDALTLLIDDPGASLDKVMKVLPGPDFPTGGFILGMDGIREAYATGRGSITMQARAAIEPLEAGKHGIIITELPYMVNKAQLVEHIAELHRAKRIDGMTALRDESDRKGMRVVIELRRDADPNLMLNRLYKHTRLRTTFGVNALALVEGVPRTLGIVDMLKHFIAHRQEVLTRRTRFELRRAQERAHVLEGYRIALRHLDAVIELIKKSKSTETARKGLMKQFKMSERQAQAVLELMLQRLTNLEREKIQEEYRELIKRIAYLEDLLANPRKILALVRDELAELKTRHADERRTRIRAEGPEEISIQDLIAEEDVVVTVTRDGYVKRLPLDTYRTQGRGGRGIIGLTHKEQDTVDQLFIASTHHILLCFTNRGRVYRIPIHAIPQASRQARGTAIINLIQIQPGEQVTATRTIKEFSPNEFLVMATTRGMVKKTPLAEYDTRLKGGIIAIKLASGDELSWVKITDGSRDIALATRRGQAIRFSEKQVRPMGRVAGGVRGIRLRDRDEVVGMEIVRKDHDLLVATLHGYGKRTAFDEYRPQSRGGIGLKTLNITSKNGPLVDMKPVEADDDVLVITSQGQIIRQRVATIRRTGRSAQGVRLIRLDEGDTVSGLARVVRKEERDDVKRRDAAEQPPAPRAPKQVKSQPAAARKASGQAKRPARKKAAPAAKAKPAKKAAAPAKKSARAKRPAPGKPRASAKGKPARASAKRKRR